MGGQRGLHAQIAARRGWLQPGQARLGVDSSAPALSCAASPTVWCRKGASGRLGFEDPSRILVCVPFSASPACSFSHWAPGRRWAWGFPTLVG